MKLLSSTMMAVCLCFSGFAAPAQATLAWCFPMPGFGWGPAYGWAAPPMYAPAPQFVGYAPTWSVGYGGNCCAPVAACCPSPCGDSCGSSCSGTVSSDKVPGPERDGNFNEKREDTGSDRPSERNSYGDDNGRERDRERDEFGGAPLSREPEGSGFGDGGDRSRLGGDDDFDAGASDSGDFGVFGDPEEPGSFGSGDDDFDTETLRRPEMVEPEFESLPGDDSLPDPTEPQAGLRPGRLSPDQARVHPAELRTRHRLTNFRRTADKPVTRWSGRRDSRQAQPRWIGAPAADGRVRL